jgi:hypothetical protein
MLNYKLALNAMLFIFRKPSSFNLEHFGLWLTGQQTWVKIDRAHDFQKVVTHSYDFCITEYSINISLEWSSNQLNICHRFSSFCDSCSSSKI